MALFDDFGSRLSTTGKSVVQKTKDATETLRLRAQIAEENRKIRETYEALGKRYFELHGNDTEYRLAEYADAIRASQTKLAEYRGQITALHGAEECPYCGAEIPPDAVFCHVCGKKLPQPDEEPSSPKPAFCASCGERIQEGTAFCPICGAKR